MDELKKGIGLRSYGQKNPVVEYRMEGMDMFDDMVAAQVRRLGQAWPELIRPLQFAVEDVPPSDPTPWQTEPNMTSQCFPASHGIPARVVLYRMPLQTEAPTKLELQLAVRDELVARIAELYGRRPEEIDPDWGL